MSEGLNWFIELTGQDPVELRTDETPAVPEPRPGRQIAGRFELLEQLGEGGMGVVYHARELASGRSVAIKLMHGAITARQRERFRREGVVTASLDHPGIVSIHGAGAVNGAPYLVYEYVPGGRTLRDLMDEKAPRAQLLALLRDAADALGVAHAAGVVHRDVKPGNLLVDADGRVRVADFGLVRAVGLETLTQTGEMLGTPRYMPLEQFEHDRVTVGPTADVWALGAILHEVVTGSPPFPKVEGLVGLVGAIKNIPVAPRRLQPGLEPDLEAICKRALRLEPSERYRDAAGFATDLTRFLAGARPLTIVRARRRRVALLGGVGVVVIAVGAVLLSRSPSAGETLSRTLAEVEAGRADTAALASALAGSANAAPSLRAAAHMRLAAGRSGDRPTWERRLEHARQAADLDPGRGAEAHGFAARALVELGRYDEAGEVFSRARRLGRTPALLLQDASLLIGCGRWKEAGAALRGYKAASGADPLARRLALEIAIGTGSARQAVVAGGEELSLSARTVLASQLAEVTGGDPFPALQARAGARPGDGEVSAALIRHHLERVELVEASHVLERAVEAGYAAPPELGPAIAALARRRVDLARRLPRPWKLAVGRCLARLVRREQDLARQSEDPRYESGSGALSPSRRRVRVKRYLAFLREELETEALEPRRDAGPGSAPAALRQARTLLDRGRQAEALVALDRFLARRDYDLGSYDELRTTALALRGVQPATRERLLTWTTAVAPRALQPVTPGENDRSSSGPPYDWNSLYRTAALRLRTDAGEALPAMVLAASRAPRLLLNLRNDLFRFTRANQIVGSRVTLATLARKLTGSSWLDRLARSTLGALAMEWEGAAPSPHELDQVLAEYPGVVFARVLRVIVLVKAGRTRGAREELTVVDEVFPDPLPTTALVKLLLLAKEGASPKRVLTALRTARSKGFRVGEFWKTEDLPELVPYMKDSRIRALLTRRSKRR